MSAPGFEHDLQHTNINDMMRAVQATIGTTNSPVTSSLTFQINAATGTISILQNNVSTISSQILILNSNTTANTNSIATNSANISTLTVSKLNLNGGTLTGQVTSAYKPPVISPSVFSSSQILLSNTTSTDNPPSLGFQFVGSLGMALYLTANGLHAITSGGGSSLIINSSGQLNPGSFPAGSVPGTVIASAGIGTTQLAAGAVTTAIMADNSVTSTKLAAGAAFANLDPSTMGARTLYTKTGGSPSGGSPGDVYFIF